MRNLTISIFGNKIFLEIINEIKLFSKFKIKYYDDLNFCIKDAEKQNQLVIFFITELNKSYYKKIKINNFPLITITTSSTLTNISVGELINRLDMPFTIQDFKKKVISVIAKYEFKKNSLIYLNDYTIDKNERKIKKMT